MYLETQPFISTNLKQVLHETENTSYLIKLICQFLLLFKQTWESKFLISLDPVIDNFGLDKKERIVFFDFFPQYQRLSENNFFDWPPALPERRPFILKRHFSEKQAQVIYAQLLRALIKKPILSTQIIKKLIGEYLGSKAFDYIDTNSKKTLKILKNPTIDDADTLRIIAAEFSYEKKLDTAHLEEIFNLTHIFPIKKINLQNNLIKAANIIAKKH